MKCTAQADFYVVLRSQNSRESFNFKLAFCLKSFARLKVTKVKSYITTKGKQLLLTKESTKFLSDSQTKNPLLLSSDVSRVKE